jgi:serine/threonine-protein kinase
MLPLKGGEPEPLDGSSTGDWSASLSPDGRFLAYDNRSAARQAPHEEIYVRPFPESGRRWPISTQGGSDPVWSSDGREIFYREAHRLMAVTVRTSPEMEFSDPVPLFEGDYIFDNPSRPWDVSPDGQRFAVNRSYLGDAEGASIHVILNWFSELERLVPTK